jgi:hypothetical protein
MANNWRTVVDAAGVERRVRPVDAREIEAVAQGVEVVKPEAPKEAVIEVDDQSVAPKAKKK